MLIVFDNSHVVAVFVAGQLNLRNWPSNYKISIRVSVRTIFKVKPSMENELLLTGSSSHTEGTH